MVEFEADDALAAAAAHGGGDARVDQVVICTPDKDLAQCVRGQRDRAVDRRTRDAARRGGRAQEIRRAPESIPDWLALAGDSADGYPGLPGWGAKSASTVLARYGHLERIPKLASGWDVSGARAAAGLARRSAARASGDPVPDSGHAAI